MFRLQPLALLSDLAALWDCHIPGTPPLQPPLCLLVGQQLPLCLEVEFQQDLSLSVVLNHLWHWTWGPLIHVQHRGSSTLSHPTLHLRSCYYVLGHLQPLWSWSSGPVLVLIRACVLSFRLTISSYQSQPQPLSGTSHGGTWLSMAHKPRA